MKAPNDKLVVANNKGVGALGPDAGAAPLVAAPGGGISPIDVRGSASVIPLPGAEGLHVATATVFHNNGWDLGTTLLRGSPAAPPRAIPENVGEPSLIKHVFYVIKENRTYDQVLGDDPRGNGDPSKVQFGAPVTPNHHALASEFPLFDNFYVNGALSADGHYWLMQSYSTDYIEEAFGDFSRSYPYDGGDALAYSPTPFLWEHARRHGRSVRVYGEMADHADKSGTRSDIPSLDAILDRKYPRFDLRVKDRARAALFKASLADQLARNAVPNLTILQLPMDHTRGLGPGVTAPISDMADNDYALGEIVEAISSSAIWRESAIFVVEDDAQGGLDHVDGHRTLAYVISPYAKRGHVDHTYYTQIDMVRTIEQILGLPPMTQSDLLGTPMRTAFTDTAVTTPYTAIAPTVPSLRNPKTSEVTGMALLWAKACEAIDFDHPDTAPGQILNRAIWYSVRGFVPYPGDGAVLTPAQVRARYGDDD